MYKFTFEEIALMTPYQQLALLNPDTMSDTLFFATQDEFERWQTRRQ